jgi:tetratricopeptide (TPR) repeat protein
MAENPRIEELRRRVLADPASIAFAALAEEFRRVGRYEEAVETCRTGLQRHPAYLSARVTLGRALIETGDYDGAREQLETVLRSAPENLAAIRGIAQINEHLGHSTEMDPQLAEVMHTMHVESLRAAAERVSVVSEPPPVQPVPAEKPAPEPAFIPPAEVPLSTAPATDRGDADQLVDVFARFAPASAKRAPAHDLTFDLSNAFADKRTADRPADAPMDFSRGTPSLEAQPALGIEPEPASDAGPHPEVLATLARLERFLGAIHSLRA